MTSERSGLVQQQVWIALDRRARRPSLPYPPLRVDRFGGETLVG
jgi:hypothetical protein